MLTLLVPICLTLAACGGGGGDAPINATAAATPPQASQALASDATQATAETLPTASVATGEPTGGDAAPDTAGILAVGALATNGQSEAIAAAAMPDEPAADAVANTHALAERSNTTSIATAGGTTPTVTIAAAAVTRRTLYVNAGKAAANDRNPGTQDLPFKSINAAMAILQAGDDVVIGPGTYREAVVIPTLAGAVTRTTLRASMAGTAVIKGSAVVTGFAASGLGTQAVNWAVEPAMVLLNGAPLRQVGGTVFGGYPGSGSYMATAKSIGNLWPARLAGDASTMTAGSFYYDGATKKLHLKTSTSLQASDVVEVSNQRHVLKGAAADKVTLQGLRIEHANTSVFDQQGAVLLQGNDIVIDDIAVHNVDSFCVQLQGNRNQLINSRFTRCGQAGINAGGDAVLIQGNTVSEANWRGFNKWWAAGGMKLVGVPRLTNSTVRANTVHNNAGDGIWVDWKNAGITIEDNTAAYNTGFGIHYEASTTGLIRRNYVYGNSQRGIYLNLVSDTVVERNSVFMNTMEGIAVVLDDRVSADTTFSPNRNKVQLNVIAWNDQGRNFIQLVLPPAPYVNLSNSNLFASATWQPRMNLGWMSSANSPSYGLAAWRTRTGQDGLSQETFGAPPAAATSSVDARRLISAAEMPAVLRVDSLR